MTNPYDVVKQFEDAVADYTGAPFCISVNSCTNALFLCLMYQKYCENPVDTVICPTRTYVSVPMQIKHAGYSVEFSYVDWGRKGYYQLEPFRIWDSARLFTSNMFLDIVPSFGRNFVCTSHHWSKTLGIQQGGCILTDSVSANRWLRKARFDGRTEGVAVKDDSFDVMGWHMYLSPEIAAEGLMRLSLLPKHNAPLPMDDYPDLSKLEIFK